MLKTRDTARYFVIALEGRLDMAYLRSGLEEEILESVRREDVQRVIFDLSKVEYVSSSGLRVLINVLRILKAKDGELRLAAISPEVMKILQAAQLVALFPHYSTVEKAMED